MLSSFLIKLVHELVTEVVRIIYCAYEQLATVIFAIFIQFICYLYLVFVFTNTSYYMRSLCHLTFNFPLSLSLSPTPLYLYPISLHPKTGTQRPWSLANCARSTSQFIRQSEYQGIPRHTLLCKAKLIFVKSLSNFEFHRFRKRRLHQLFHERLLLHSQGN